MKLSVCLLALALIEGADSAPQRPHWALAQGAAAPRACSAHSKCAKLAGNCCPTKDNVILDCCDKVDTPASCSRNPKCDALGLAGNCCPTKDGVHLDCCPKEDTCSKFPKCKALGLTGLCCPTKDSVMLDCCKDDSKGPGKDTPMAQTVKLIEGLKKNVENDGKKEQAEFDEYACWCEKTMERKANHISEGKATIEEMQTLIKKLKGEIASHGAEIQQLNKDIAQNNEAVKEATDLRNKENSEYAGERAESEQCIGALEAAMKVLTAGTKTGFLEVPEAAQEAQLLSVVGGIKKAMSLVMQKGTHVISDKDLEVVNQFVARPSDFVAKRGGALTQTGQNPFGDYAPQSTQIQGILQGQYDAFTADLEKDNAAEAESQKSFEELMATKKQERETLEATLEKQETDMAAKQKKQAESEVLRDDTAADVAHDEEFFADTKEACQTKATQWSVRTRLRTEELNGMVVAIGILSSKDAKATFGKSTTTFLQLASVHKHTLLSGTRMKAYDKLRLLATQLQSRSVAKIAVEVKTGGHFDKVIAMIDDMMALLRKEEQSDIEHRDRCENDQNANANEMADLESSVKKTQAAIDRMDNTAKKLRGEISALEDDIADTRKDMAVLLTLRNKEEANFKMALQDDADAANLLGQAIAALSSFYKRNKMDVPQLIQKPEYSHDDDKAPKTSWSGSDYGGRKSESGGIIAILQMLKEDTEKEMAEGRADNADAQAKYMKQNGALQASLDGQSDTKASTEQALADLEEKINDYEKFRDNKKDDKAAEGDTAKALDTDCKWVKTHFQDRRDKRKTEMQGLVDAKSFLASGGSGII